MRSWAYGSRVAFLPFTSAGFAALLLLSACGGGKDGPTEPPKTEPPKATALRFATAPTSAQAGEALGPTIRVELIDSAGRLVTGSDALITLALAGGAEDARLLGSTTAQSSGGVATFGGLTIERTGIGYTLQAHTSGLSSATSAPFEVRSAAPASAEFIAMPGSAGEAQEPLTPAVEVKLRDRFGNLVHGWAGTVNVALKQNPGNATLLGTLAKPAVNGVARFDDLSITNPGTGYTLAVSVNELEEMETTPIDIRLTLASVLTGGSVSCGLTPTGKAYCWGDGRYGMLGTGTTSESLTPVAVAGGLSFTTLSGKFSHFCGLTAAGTAYCWGRNWVGQLGTDDTVDRSVPVAVKGGLTFTMVSAGSDHACGIATSGKAYCWGNNAQGQLGIGNTFTVSYAPMEVAGGVSFSALSAGVQYTCGTTAAGEAYCWGRGTEGQLGHGGNFDSNTPGLVSGATRFTMLSTGNMLTCGRSTTGQAYCWGNGVHGQLGNGTTTSSPTPVAVASPLNFASVSAAGEHTCGRTTDGAAFCWGRNNLGQLGTNGSQDSASPVEVGLILSTLSAGGYHACGTTAAGEAYCWGYNGYGQLGIGVKGTEFTPVLVIGTKH